MSYGGTSTDEPSVSLVFLEGCQSIRCQYVPKSKSRFVGHLVGRVGVHLKEKVQASLNLLIVR
jgi:hypothetical protein